MKEFETSNTILTYFFSSFQRYNIALQQLEEDALSRSSQPNSPANTGAGGSDTLRRDKDRQATEIKILRKTIEEMELRIDTQKQTLTARDESIRKLLEMLQGKGNTSADSVEAEKMRLKIVDEERKVRQMEYMLKQRDLEMAAMKDVSWIFSYLYMDVLFDTNITVYHSTAIVGVTILVPCHVVNSLKIIWRSGNYKSNLGTWSLIEVQWFNFTHWGQVTHICVSKLTIFGSDNGLSPGLCQTIIWSNTGILLIRPLGTNFNEMLIEILTFSFMTIRLKASSAK